MNRSAPKIMLLTATFGPIFQGNHTTLETQCQYLRDHMPRGTRKRTTLTPDAIRRWRREGVTRTRRSDNLHKFCAAVCSLLRLSETADEIATSIVDDRMSEFKFAEKIGLQKIEADYILAQHDSSRGIFFPDRTKLYDTTTLANDKKDHTFGIYIIERIEDGGRQSTIPECVLVIDKYIETEREPRGFIFIKMFVPRLGSSTQLAEYSGMLLQTNDHRYFFLQSVDDYQDFVSIITNIGAVPLQLLEGIYISVNIEGISDPGHRKVLIRRKEGNVTDALIEKYKNLTVRPR